MAAWSKGYRTLVLRMSTHIKARTHLPFFSLYCSWYRPTYTAAHSTNNLTLLHTCVIAQDPTRTQLLGYLLYHAARQLVPISTTSHQKSVLLQSRLHQHADSLNDDYVQTSYLGSLVSFLLMYITACIIEKVREVMNCVVNESLIRFGEQLIQCISSQRWLCIVWDTGIQGYRDTG